MTRALKNVLAQGEAAASIPWHIRDPETHATIDFYVHRDYVTHGNEAGKSAWLPSPRTPWAMDQAHQPALNYLPYLLTGDPYYLEGLQAQMTFNTLWTRHNRWRGGRMVINTSQTRGYAWALRTPMQLARVVPDTAPSWLLPRSYYQRYLADNMAWMQDTFIGPNATWPTRHLYQAVNHDGKAAGHGQPWAEDFLATVLGWGVRMGHENMRPAFAWKIRNTIDRFSGTSGYPRQYGSRYAILYRDGAWWPRTGRRSGPSPRRRRRRTICPICPPIGRCSAMAVTMNATPAAHQYLHDQIQANLKSNGPIWKWAVGSSA